MRQPRTSLPALGLALTSVVAFAVAPSSDGAPDVETVPYMATDQAGDANALNDQGLPLVAGTAPGTSTGAAQLASADVLGARITSVYDEVIGEDGLVDHRLTGLEFRTGLSAEPTAASPAVIHRFRGTIGGCEAWVQATTGAAGGQTHGTASVRILGTACGVPDDAAGLRGSETLTGDGITYGWDADHGELVVGIDLRTAPGKLTDTIERGAYYTLTDIENRHYSAAGVTAPVIDMLQGPGYTEIGADIPADEQPSGGGDDGSGDDGAGDGGGDFDADGHRGGDGNDVPRDTTSVCGRYDGSVGTTPTQGSDRTGAGADTLALGMHAPATGAAPLPTTSFEHSRDLYWRAVTEQCGETVLGRTDVEVEFRDDKYDPSSAGQVCKELASRSFLLLGAGGTDQIQRCGQLAHVGAFPYFSVGVTQAGLEGNPWYFASTMSFHEQGGLLASYVAANPDGNRVLGADARIGSLVTDTPNFDDALQGWHEGLAANGLQNQTTFRHAKGDTSWYAAAAEEFKQQGVEVVYFLSSPVDLIQFANTANERYGYNPLYVGVASDTSLDAVLHGGCGEPGRTIDGGIWLSGTPALDAAPTAFLEAAQQFDAPGDDIALRLWAFAEQQRELLEGYGEVFGHDLTREDFRAFAEDGAHTDGTFPATTWSPSDHFPREAMHVVQANCERRQHVTLHVDAAGF